MTSNETRLVDNLIEEMQQERDVELSGDIAFEIFASTMALAENDVTVDSIEAGRIGGGGDGGIDSIYFFIDDELVEDDSEVLQENFDPSTVRKQSNFTLKIIQAKRTQSFEATAFDKVSATLEKFLDLGKGDEELSEIYSPDLVTGFSRFRNSWLALNSRHPRINIEFIYASKGDTGFIHDLVHTKAGDLRQKITQMVPGIEKVEILFLGSRELWERSRMVSNYDLELRFEDYVSKGNSYAGLVTIRDFNDFLTDDNGSLQGHLFDSNVRDYQQGVIVNKKILENLKSTESKDFWWYNNGITILCTDVSIGGDKTFALSNVQVVNGLQTSHSIHQYIGEVGDSRGNRLDRSVQVRVIQTNDEAVRDDIIRATNSQTKVPDASLHATEEIHRQIESYFRSQGWFYDRRKNYYKNAGKRADRIVGIPALGQAVMAIGLGRPNDARARPSSLLNRDSDYAKIFDPSLPLPVYLWIAHLQKRVDELLLSEPLNVDSYVRTNSKFYISMFLAVRALGQKIYSPKQLNSLSDTLLEVTQEMVSEGLSVVQEESQRLNASSGRALDRISKNGELVEPIVTRALDDA